MDLTAVVEAGRRVHGLILTDTVTVERHAGMVLDDLGTRTDAWEPVYSGPGLVQASATKPQTTDSAGRPLTVVEYIGKVPVSVVLTPRTRYRVRVLESLDPGNLGTYEGLMAESNGLAIVRRLHLART